MSEPQDVLAEAREALRNAINAAWHSRTPADECWIDYSLVQHELDIHGYALVRTPETLDPNADMFSASDFDDPESPFYDDSPWVPVPASLGGAASPAPDPRARLREALVAVGPGTIADLAWSHAKHEWRADLGYWSAMEDAAGRIIEDDQPMASLAAAIVRASPSAEPPETA